MIYTTLRVTDTIFAFALVVLLVFILKRKNIVSTGDLKKYSKLMTTGVLPAVIFLQLSQNPVHGHQFVLVLIMFFAGFLSMVVNAINLVLRQSITDIQMRKDNWLFLTHQPAG